MGLSHSRGTRNNPSAEEIAVLFSVPDGIALSNASVFSACALGKYSVLKPGDPDRESAQNAIVNPSTPQENKAMGCLLGCVIGDALGSPLEFSAAREVGEPILKGLQDSEVWTAGKFNRFGLKPGQWTDDASMALCMSDSLLVHQKVNTLDMRMRFWLWWSLGYNNAFGYDQGDADGRGSVGLGGNISSSFTEFVQSRGSCGGLTKAGDMNTSGNGSLMRLAPIPVFYHANVQEAMEAAALSSKTTHQGNEAAECCRLLSYVCVELINYNGTNPKEILESLPANFESSLYSVTCLANSVAEKSHKENKGLDLNDRNWNWKREHHRYAPGRSAEMPGYVGSYCMDALAMALHCAYTTNSFSECALKAANKCGDADTVCDIACQIAGAMYGARNIPKEWVDIMQQWDNRGDVATKAFKLFHHNPL